MGADTIFLVALASPIRIGGLNLSNDIVSLVMGVASPFQLFVSKNWAIVFEYSALISSIEPIIPL